MADLHVFVDGTLTVTENINEYIKQYGFGLSDITVPNYQFSQYYEEKHRPFVKRPSPFFLCSGLLTVFDKTLGNNYYICCKELSKDDTIRFNLPLTLRKVLKTPLPILVED